MKAVILTLLLLVLSLSSPALGLKCLNVFYGLSESQLGWLSVAMDPKSGGGATLIRGTPFFSPREIAIVRTLLNTEGFDPGQGSFMFSSYHDIERVFGADIADRIFYLAQQVRQRLESIDQQPLRMRQGYLRTEQDRNRFTDGHIHPLGWATLTHAAEGPGSFYEWPLGERHYAATGDYVVMTDGARARQLGSQKAIFHGTPHRASPDELRVLLILAFDLDPSPRRQKAEK